MILTDLRILLEGATIDEERLEIATHQYGTFIAIPEGIIDGEDDLACDFRYTNTLILDSFYLKDIASVRRVGEVEYAYIAEKEFMKAI